MGGKGSGRKPDMSKRILNNYTQQPQKVGTSMVGSSDGIDLYIPDYSGVQNHEQTLNAFDNRYYSIDKIDDGTTSGQMLYWNGTKWKPAGSLLWDETNYRLGLSLADGVSPTVDLDIGGNLNFDPIDIPTDAEVGAITLAENLGAGTLTAGKYYYNIKWVDAYGNSCGTNYGTSPDITVSANSAVTLSNIPLTNGDSRIVARDIFRTEAGASVHLARKIARINDITTTTFQDTGYAGDATDIIYRSPNSTAGVISIADDPAMVLSDYFTSFGKRAGEAQTASYNSVLIGSQAGKNLTSGQNNNFLGYQTGLGLTTGGNNQYWGYTAGAFLGDDSANNIAVGNVALRQASQNSVDSDFNIALGTYALNGGANGHTGNIGIGYEAGRYIAVAGRASYNTLIGYRAGKTTLDNGDYNICIGYLADVSTANAQREINIGNTIYGDQVNANLWFQGDGSGYPYGHMYTNTTIAVTIASTNTPTEIGDTWTTGEVALVSFGSSHYLTVTKAGRYKVDWSLSISQNSPSAAIQCEQGIMINGSAVNQGKSHRTIANSSDIGASAGVAILDLAANDQVSLYVENQTNTTNIDVEHGNLTVTMVGGT